MPLKRKPITEAATQSPSDDEEDEDFELGLLDDTLSSDEDSDDDDGSNESGHDAESESGENSDNEESDEEDQTNGAINEKTSNWPTVPLELNPKISCLTYPPSLTRQTPTLSSMQKVTAANSSPK